MEEMTYHRKVMLICYSFNKNTNKNIKNFITTLNNNLWDVGLEVGISFLTLKQVIIDY